MRIIDRLFNRANNKDTDINIEKATNCLNKINEVKFDKSEEVMGDLDERYSYYINLDKKLESIHINSNQVVSKLLNYKECVLLQSKILDSIDTTSCLNEKIKKTKIHINTEMKKLDNIIELIEKGLWVRNNTIAGYEGEEKLNKTLEYCDDILTSHKGCRFNVLNETNESDNLIVSKFGVFNVEVKNIGSQGKVILEIEKDGRWNRYNINEKTGTKMKVEQSNVTAQVTRQSILKQRLINEELKNRGINTDYVIIKPVIVIANENVDIVNQTNDPIIRISQLYNNIVCNKPILEDSVVNEINDIINKNRLPALKYPYTDIEKSIFDAFEKLETMLELIDKIALESC